MTLQQILCTFVGHQPERRDSVYARPVFGTTCKRPGCLAYYSAKGWRTP